MLRWGLMSTARINLALLPALRECTRAEAVAVASRDVDRADAFAARHGLATAYGSYEALLDDPDVDVVYNSLPNRMHAEWTIRAAEAGKHVLCEKPLACTLEEVDAIAAAAERNGVVVAEAFMYRHHPQTLRVQEIAGERGDRRGPPGARLVQLHAGAVPATSGSIPSWTAARPGTSASTR